MNLKKLSVIFILFSLLFVGCGGGTVTQTQELSEQSSTKTLTRDMNPVSNPADLAAISKANNRLALDVYRYLQDKPSNHFASPYSIYMMLSMLSVGAEGDTREQMLRSQYLDLPDDILYESLNAHSLQFPYQSDTFQLDIAQAIWIQNDLSIESDFVDTLVKHFGMKINLIDFKIESEKAVDTINAWTKENTSDKITELLSKNSLNENTKIVLTNAIYLKAKWEKSFSKDSTVDKNFTLQTDEIIQVPTMHKKSILRYKEQNGTQMLCMNYKDSEYGLISILPPVGKFEEFEKNLTLENLRALLMDPVTDKINFKDTLMSLQYPKYQFENSINYTDPLQDLGMLNAFSTDANFGAITTDAPLQISQVIQKVFFKVDEEGTEAAASSVTALGSTGVSELTLKFNRPFFFMLCHEPTSTIMFLGRVMNPLDTK